MKVLSLFDGMSCGRIALDQLGISLETYYASEIDKYAMQVSQNNYPDIIQLGDVLTWREWDIDWASIDLVTGGFPCQAWSLAGKQLGDKDERGKMFWVMLDIMQNVLKHNPNAYYLMENVRMKKEFEEYITTHAENALPNVHKYKINSALVSAQNRVRYYWTNIPGIQQPEDKGIVLRDILDIETNENYIETHNTPKQVGVAHHENGKPLPSWGGTNKVYGQHGKSPTVMAAAGMGGNREPKVETKPKQVGIATDINGHDILKRVYSPEGKSPTLTTCGGGHREPKVVVQSYREVRTDEAKTMRKMVRQQTGKDFTPFRAKELKPREDGKVGTVTPNLNRDHTISIKNLPDKADVLKANYYKSGRANFENDKTKGGKFSATGIQNENLTWRKLTPLECERLQTVPDNYTEGVSNTQRYKMLGNGWTVEVIKHILEGIK